MTDDLRAQAISNLKAKNHFWQILGGWVLLSILFTAIWLFSGGVGSYFWPMWPILGVGIGVVAAGIAAFGSGGGGPDEAKIQAEMDRLKK
ncbi:MAG: 2TM domain-containing protein [Microbacterium sp.]